MSNTFGIGFAVGATLSPTVSNVFTTVEQKIKSSSQRMEALSAKSKALARADTLRTQVQGTQRLYAAGGGHDPLLRETLHRQVAAYKEAQAAAQKYGVAVADYGRAHAKAETQLARTQNRLQSLSKAQAAADRRKDIRGGLMEAAVPVMAAALPVKAAIDFESAMADAAKTIDGMRDDTGKLTPKYYEMESAIKALGRTLPLTHDEIARLFASGGQQGIAGMDELQDFTTMAAHMSVAFGMSTEEAADAIGGYRSAMRLSFDDTRSMLDLMNQFANTTSASEKGIADVVRRIGPLGNVGGVAAKPMTALAATLDAMKVSPEIAATGIKNLILAMTAGSAATKAQKEAYASLGISTVKLAKQMQTDGPAAIISVLEAVQKLPKAQQLSTMQEIFGKESLGAIAPLLDSLDQVKKNLVIASDETQYAGAMQQEFGNRSDTTANKLIIAGNRAKELGIILGNGLLPAINSILETAGPIVSSIAGFAQEHKTLTTVLVGAVAGFLTLRLAGMGAAYMFHGVSGAYHITRAALGFLIPGLRAAAVAEGATAAAANASGASSLRTSAAWVWHKGVMIAGAAASRAAAAGQWLLNAAMYANPIGLVIAGVVALVGGMIYLYNTCEPIRTAFDKVFGFIGAKVGWAVGKLRTVGEWLGVVDKAEAVPVPDGVVTAPPPDVPALPTSGAVPSLPSKADLDALGQGGMPGAAGAMPAMGGAGASVSMNFTLNGLSDAGFAKRLMAALDNNRGEFERLVSSIVHDQERLAYGG
ncbi:phage tail tape measure protein [Desulfovibrio sp. 86]|uniref:Phage tail tape measure protein domain-containing protein n=1 Tax=uncultured Desulfovibrio sp. TaxID=167968 RepID=A0A212KXI4_9BACT|nr:phage tail tape measure protein [Desulfovibrio sp. 86]SCM69993.1 conserved membrane hypothetical protein [uncultured Desulfovibrio sp.]VZH35328.1 conserved membrane protein of unknown function [Desulfovibrio sp. 86]